MKWYPFLLIGLIGGLIACDNTESSTETTTDSVTVEVPVELEDTTGLAATTIAPELIGTWIMQEMRVGNEPLPIEDIEDSSYEFRADGTLVVHDEESVSDPMGFRYENNTIYSELLEADFLVEELSATKLVLSIEKLGMKIKYTYQKK